MPYSDKYWLDGQPLQGDSSAASLLDKYWIDGTPAWTIPLAIFTLVAETGTFVITGQDVDLIWLLGELSEYRTFVIASEIRVSLVPANIHCQINKEERTFVCREAV